MTKKEAKKHAHGLYRIFWKDGSSSLAAVGSLHDGTPWFAAANWTSRSSEGIACDDWHGVERMVLIRKRVT